MCEKTEVVNVREAITTSKSKFVRNMPGFMIKYVERVIRQKEMNEAYRKYCHLQGMDFVKALLFDEFNVNVRIHGEKNVEPGKLYVYSANHPLGAIDALSFLYLIHKIHGKVISPSNELFEFVPNLHPVIVGINVFGHNTKGKAMAVNKAFETDAQIMYFPAGEVSRKIKGKIQDPPWQKSFVSKAVQFQRDIVPVYITGKNSKKFYRVANIRKALGIKLYVETMLLPQEMFRGYNMDIDLYIGKPISWEEIKESGISHNEWAQKIRGIVYQMEEKFKNQIK